MSSTLPTLPALIDGTVFHTRRSPFKHAFRYRAYQWLVDLDHLPRLPIALRPFASFRPADHFGDPDRSIKDNVLRFLQLHDVDLSGGRVLMLANARVLGHVFDPLSVFWCFDADGRLVRIIAEVHNTYSERHAYLLNPDATGRARVDKALYVSPFFNVDGHYELQFSMSDQRVRTTVTLRHGEDIPFSATFTGRVAPYRPGAFTRLLVQRPLMTQRVSLLIRLHGVRLWSRGLKVRARPLHRHQEGVR